LYPKEPFGEHQKVRLRYTLNAKTSLRSSRALKHTPTNCKTQRFTSISHYASNTILPILSVKEIQKYISWTSVKRLFLILMEEAN